MKIIHVSPTYYPVLGGGELYLKEISEGLASRGHDVTVVTANVSNHEDLWPGNHGDLAENQVINGVKIVRFHPNGGLLGLGIDRWRRMRGGYRTLSLIFGHDGFGPVSRKPSLFQAIPYLARTKADIVATINWYWPPAYHAYLARKVRRFHLVGIPLFHTAQRWSHDTVYDRMLARCDGVMVMTTYEAEFVQQRASTRVQVTGVGVHPGLFESRNGKEIRAQYQIGSCPVVGFVGRQVANKGVTALIRAMHTVWKWNDQVRLVLAGPRLRRNDDVESLLQCLSDFERDRIIQIHDFSDEDKPSIYDSFDVFAMPSTSESFGIAYLEAWLSRKPVIGGRIGPTECVIDEGVNGLLADPNDPDDIARAIIELLGDKGKRERMGDSGYAQTVTQFTWDQVTDKVEKLYTELRDDNRK